MSTTSADRRSEPGQATVEFALVVPLLVLCCAVLLVVARTTSDQVALVRASGTVAREAALAPDDAARLRALLHEVVHLRPVDVETTRRDGLVTVTLRHDTRVRLLGIEFSLRTLSANATMPLEDGG